jgi:hypothetical protein
VSGSAPRVYCVFLQLSRPPGLPKLCPNFVSVVIRSFGGSGYSFHYDDREYPKTALKQP